RGLPPRRFRGSITRPWHSLSTLRPVHCCTRTQDSLPAVGHSTGRAWLPAGFRRKVSSCFLHLFPLSQAFLAQCRLPLSPSGRPLACGFALTVKRSFDHLADTDS